jgi:hypothetical protein
MHAMRYVVGAMLAAGALLAFGGIVGAKVPSSPTKVVFDQESPQTGEGVNDRDLIGHLESPRKQCLVGRTVKAFLHNNNTGTTKLIDVDRTGRNGLWGVGGNIEGAAFARFTVTRKQIGHRHHRRICKADSTVIHFA